MEELKELHILIEGCKSNDRKSQEKLYRSFYPMLYCLCRKFFTNEHEVLEVLNDGLLKVFKNISMYQTERGSFFNWVYTIVRNAALDKIRLVSKPVFVEILPDGVYNDGSNPLKKLEGKELYKWLDCLPPATRTVCNLFYLEDYSINNICDELNLSSGTVKWHLSESRKKLEPVLKKYFLKH